MVETMRREGHKALVHTAAASNLGQMLNRICIKDRIGLVNIVRKPEQEALLRAAGAEHVCNATSPTFMESSRRRWRTPAPRSPSMPPAAASWPGRSSPRMEAALNRVAKEYSRYGSSTHKQVYIYGGLDTGPTEFNRNFGMAWGVGGWLLTPFLQRIGPHAAQALKQRVAAELKTTFASRYARQISLAEALQPAVVATTASAPPGPRC